MFTGETYFGGENKEGSRIFSVIINNKIYARDIQFSVKWESVLLEYVIEIEKGNSLSIKLDASIDNAMLAGIEITPAAPNAELTQPLGSLTIEEGNQINLLRINCGGGGSLNYIDSENREWVVDSAYRTGGWGITSYIARTDYDNMNSVTNADVEDAPLDFMLYRTNIWGNPLEYQFDNLESGDYVLNIYMIEDYFNEANRRLFDIFVLDLENGMEANIKKVNDDPIDLWRMVGKNNPYEILGFEFTVREGVPVLIRFASIIENGVVSAIELIKK